MFELGVILYSLHMYVGVPEKEYDNRTPGIFVSYVDTGTSVGIVRNSYRRTSFFVSQQLWEKGRWSINGSVFTGYIDTPILPVVSFNVRVTNNLKLSYIPPKPNWGEYGTIVTVLTFK